MAQTENWDDDFEDNTVSPARQLASRPYHRCPKLPEIPEPENWDDDIGAGKSSCPPRKTKHGTRWTTRITKKRTRPSLPLHILVRSLSSSLLPVPIPASLPTAFPNISRRGIPWLSNHVGFFLFPLDATRLRTRQWRISPCVAECLPRHVTT